VTRFDRRRRGLPSAPHLSPEDRFLTLMALGTLDLVSASGRTAAANRARELSLSISEGRYEAFRLAQAYAHAAACGNLNVPNQSTQGVPCSVSHRPVEPAAPAAAPLPSPARQPAAPGPTQVTPTAPPAFALAAASRFPPAPSTR
jgi:hypothetical protein